MVSTAAERLLGLKATLTDPLEALISWKPDTNPCGAEPWHGLLCRDGYVVAITLEGSALQGPLPTDLFQISTLQGLYLQSNQITGDNLKQAVERDQCQRCIHFQLDCGVRYLLQSIKLLYHVHHVAVNQDQLPVCPVVLNTTDNLVLHRSGTLPAIWGDSAAHNIIAIDLSDNKVCLRTFNTQSQPD